MGAEDIAVIKKHKLKNAQNPTDLDSIRESIRATIAIILGHLLAKQYSVETELGDKTTIFVIDLQQEDFGRLLGAQGRNIKGLRTLVAAMAGTHGMRAIVSIKDEDRFM